MPLRRVLNCARSSSFSGKVLLSSLALFSQIIPSAFADRIDFEAIEPMLSTEWNQSGGYRPNFTYNNKTPLVGTAQTERAPVGCIAVAFGQVLNYYQYPRMGTGYKAYCNSGGSMYSCADPVEANFYQEQYQWANMTPALNSMSSSESIDAVSTLLYHIGASVSVKYGENGSAAKLQNPSIIDRFKMHFGMSNIERAERVNYTDDEWFNLVVGELKAERPVVMVGTSNALGGAGHAYVIDGINVEGKVHINWGWGGHANGYYDLATLRSPYGAFTDGLVALVKFSPNSVEENGRCHGPKGARCQDGLVCTSETSNQIIDIIGGSDEYGICLVESDSSDVVDEEEPTPEPQPEAIETVVVTKSAQITRQQWMHLGAFSTEEAIEITMTGDGDADLYVRKDYQPTTSVNDCASIDYGSVEACSLAGAGVYYVSIRGYANVSNFTIEITTQAVSSREASDESAQEGAE